MSIARISLLTVLVAGCVPSLYSSGSSQGEWVPPENSWPISEPPPDLVGVGYQERQTIPDARLRDQHGAEVSTWQFYGEVVLIDISTMWCSPCQDIARHVQPTQDDYADEGFVYLTILHENVHNQPPSQADLDEWAEAFGIEAPILADGDQVTAAAVTQNQYPAVIIVGRDMSVVERVKVLTDAEIRKAVERAL